MRIAVCDDEPEMRGELKRRIDEFMEGRGRDWEVVLFGSAADLLEQPDCDLIFLDIQMPGINGMDAARILRGRGFTGEVVFTTVLEDYVYDAFDVEAAGYLVKPVNSEKFSNTMERVLKKTEQRSKSIVIRCGDTMEIVPYERIVYCEVRGHTLEVHTKGGRILASRGRLDDLEKKTGPGFFRCHRSYLVNLGFVRSCGGGQVTMSTDDKVPMSRLREKDLKRALSQYLSEKTR